METILLRVEYPSSAPPCVLVSFEGGRRGTIRSAPLGCPPVPSSPGEILPSDEREVPPPFRSSLSSTLVDWFKGNKYWIQAFGIFEPCAESRPNSGSLHGLSLILLVYYSSLDSPVYEN